MLAKCNSANEIDHVVRTILDYKLEPGERLSLVIEDREFVIGMVLKNDPLFAHVGQEIIDNCCSLCREELNAADVSHSVEEATILGYMYEKSPSEEYPEFPSIKGFGVIRKTGDFLNLDVAEVPLQQKVTEGPYVCSEEVRLLRGTKLRLAVLMCFKIFQYVVRGGEQFKIAEGVSITILKYYLKMGYLLGVPPLNLNWIIENSPDIVCREDEPQLQKRVTSYLYCRLHYDDDFLANACRVSRAHLDTLREVYSSQGIELEGFVAEMLGKYIVNIPLNRFKLHFPFSTRLNKMYVFLWEQLGKDLRSSFEA